MEKRHFLPGATATILRVDTWFFFACSFCLQEHPDLILDFYFHGINREKKTCK